MFNARKIAGEIEREYENLKNKGTMKDYSNYTISELANVIWKDWNNKMYFGAVPYWQAMTTMTSIDDAYGFDSGRSIVMYFLGNANTWRGEIAREVKKELNKRLK